jgi:DNA-binding beta-propeller fold protein YncE
MTGGVMDNIVKSNAFSFRVDFEWAKLPAGWSFFEIADIATDSRDRVFVFCRGEHPVMVFSRDGSFLFSWGEGLFKRAHGITIGPDDNLYCVDDLDHTAKKFTPEGKLLLTVGTPGKPAAFQGGSPFNQPTKVALEPGTGAFYVSDGYGNARVHKYSAEGELLFSWGRSGSDPGEFNLVHSICTDRQGRVYVADRESHRIQVFDDTGRYITQWNNLHRPCGFFITQGDPQLAIIGQIPPSLKVNIRYPNLGARITIHDLAGKRLASIGDVNPGEELPAQFLAPHGIAADSRGDIYIGEVAYSHFGEASTPPPWTRRCFRKLIRLV